MDDERIDHDWKPHPRQWQAMARLILKTQLRWAGWPTDALIGREPAAFRWELTVGYAISNTKRRPCFIVKLVG